jgi:hypothetical protein
VEKVGEVEEGWKGWEGGRRWRRWGGLAVNKRWGGGLNENNYQIVSNPSTPVDNFSLKRGWVRKGLK